MNLLHVAIPVADIAATERFYIDGLGFTRVHAFEGADGLRNVYVSDDSGTEIQFTHWPNRKDTVRSAPHHHLRQHIAVGVADLDETFADLVATIDPPVHAEPSREEASGSRIAFVADPDGHPVELVERSAES